MTIHYNKNILFSYKVNKFKLKILLTIQLIIIKIKIIKMLIIYIINWL